MTSLNIPHSETKSMMPVLYIPHGGGPLPLLGDSDHQHLVDFLQTTAGDWCKPDAIVLISAHWETSPICITAGLQPELIYDYFGFPPESYEIKYPAPGAPRVAKKMQRLLASNNINSNMDEERGFDHGMFVPLKLLYPKADIPCVQLSLAAELDAGAHINIGRALSKLREENVLIIGSGLSFHNMQSFFSATETSRQQSIEFDTWLQDTCVNEKYSTTEREHRLINWTLAPAARFCHPREEHLLPLHVCFGAALNTSTAAELMYNEDLLGHRVSGLLWR